MIDSSIKVLWKQKVKMLSSQNFLGCKTMKKKKKISIIMMKIRMMMMMTMMKITMKLMMIKMVEMIMIMMIKIKMMMITKITDEIMIPTMINKNWTKNKCKEENNKIFF